MSQEQRKVKLVGQELYGSLLFGLLGGLGLVWFLIESVTSIHKSIIFTQNPFDLHMKN